MLAALDPDVRAIEAAPVEIAGTPAPVDVLVPERTDGRFVLDVPEAYPRDLDAAGLALLAIESSGLPTLSFPAPEIVLLGRPSAGAGGALRDPVLLQAVEADLRRLQDQAEALVRAHRSQIEALADALVRHQVLGGE